MKPILMVCDMAGVATLSSVATKPAQMDALNFMKSPKASDGMTHRSLQMGGVVYQTSTFGNQKTAWIASGKPLRRLEFPRPAFRQTR
jgi:hypothetical protein